VIIAYPLVIHLGPLTVTGFGIMMALAFAVGGWVIDHETRRNGFAPDYVGDIIVGAVVGGIVGAKLWFVALPGHGVQDLFERSGLVWYGGFIGGALGVVLNGWRRRVPMRWTAQLVAPALAAAYAIGRIGCFVVGDDYGIPSTLPWAVAFPEGAPPTTAANLRAFHVAIPASVAPNTILAVHPTQLYEVFLMTIVFAILWRWRTESRGTGWLFGAYLVLAGIERFAIEFLRAKDDRQPNGFSLAQYASVAVVIVGIIVATQLSKRARTAPGEWLLRGAPEPATRAPKPT
jgi:phosphatidylglycerol:prolipoprotein diacylglycerol transferase